MLELQFFENGLYFYFLSVPAYDHRYGVAYLALPYQADKLTAVIYCGSVERNDSVLLLEAGLLCVLTCYLCDVYPRRIKSVVFGLLFRNIAYDDSYCRRARGLPADISAAFNNVVDYFGYRIYWKGKSESLNAYGRSFGFDYADEFASGVKESAA